MKALTACLLHLQVQNHFGEFIQARFALSPCRHMPIQQLEESWAVVMFPEMA